MVKPAKKLCGAKTRSGGKCKRAAGAGTDHVGSGRCSNHGGSTTSGKVAAAREEAAEAALSMAGDGVPIDPHEVMERLVWMAWYQVEFVREKVRALQEEELVGRPVQTKVTPGSALVLGLQRDEDGELGVDDVGTASTIEETHKPHELHLWVRELHASMERAAKISESAIRAGVEERRVRVAERYGATIAQLLDGLLNDIGLTPKQWEKVRSVLPGHLERVTVSAGGAA